MTGRPQFDSAHVYGVLDPIAVDLIGLEVEQPDGTPAAEINYQQPFFVYATLRVGGIASIVHLPFEIRYYFTGFGGAASGTLGTTVGKFLDDPGGAFIPACGVAREYPAVVTKITVDPNPLAQDQTYQITAVADFGPVQNNIDAFTLPTVIGTTENP
jgi:hypothetical protein